jgi:hypothetical protein
MEVSSAIAVTTDPAPINIPPKAKIQKKPKVYTKVRPSVVAIAALPYDKNEGST